MKKLLSISALLMLLLTLSACGNDPTKDEAKGCISGSDVPAAFSSIDKYKGYDIVFVGKVFNIETDESGTYFQAWQDYINYENIAVVSCAAGTEIAEDDYVKIKGRIIGTFEGENIIGGKVTAMKINAETVEKMSYIDLFSPTLKSLDVNQTKTQKGYSITIEKVEFAKNETRVYLTVANNGTDTFNIHIYSAKIKQAKKQYETQDNFEADYEELPTELITDTEASGVLVFPALEQSDFTIIIGASSDNFDEDINDYKFNIKVS